jgi:hypothetical protein
MNPWRYIKPNAMNENYPRARRDSLNFENCGGERHAPDEVEPDPFARIGRFLSKAVPPRTPARAKGANS